MAETVSTNQFKNGMHIELDGSVWRILEFQHVKPGKGGAFVRTKLRNLDSGAVVDKTFRAGEKFPRVHTEVKDVQYLYDSGDEVVFMDTDTYEQFSLPHASVEDALPYLRAVELGPGARGRREAGRPAAAAVGRARRVRDRARRQQGDTVSNVTKPATLETGAVVQVPLFVNVGDRIKVDPREGRYISRRVARRRLDSRARLPRCPRSSTRRSGCSARSRSPGGCRPPTCSGSRRSSTAPASPTSRSPAAASSTRAVRRGVESPWERIRALNDRTKTPLAMALRGRFLVGSRPVGGDFVRRFVASRAPRAGSRSSACTTR